MRDVYPSLRTYCQQRGLEFQVVDMRWGVRDETTADHKTNEICVQEIKNCQRLTPGPNFVVNNICVKVTMKQSHFPLNDCSYLSEFNKRVILFSVF